jgi:stage II sporulation protein M
MICLLAAVIGGWVASYQWSIDLSAFKANDETLLENLQSWIDAGQYNPQLISLAILQNTRVLIAATILAIFTFGVIGLLIVMIPFAIVGFILGQVTQSGLSPLPFIIAIIPHGLFEVPAITLAGAAALRLGSIVTRPPQDMTVGEAWLRALADAVKIGISLVFPLLVIAGFLEVLVTPRVLELVLKM